MTKYRVLKRSSVNVKKGSLYGGFAGLCVVLMMSCAFAGFAANAKGLDLATEDSNNWRVKDVFILPSGVQGWYIRKPVQASAGLEVPFNEVETGEYTVYIHNTWAGDLTGMKIVAKFMIKSSVSPVFVARLPDSAVQMRLEFQTTAGSWEPTDYWFSEYDYVTLTAYTATGAYTDPGILNTPLTLEVPLLPALWKHIGGVVGTYDLTAFNTAIADVQEIGFSFGRSESYASGVALSSGDATLVIMSYAIVEA